MTREDWAKRLAAMAEGERILFAYFKERETLHQTLAGGSLKQKTVLGIGTVLAAAAVAYVCYCKTK